MSNLPSVAAATAILALLTAACGTAARDEPEQSAGKASVPAALRFTAPMLDGGTFQGESLAGRPVALWFWAPWCPKCLSDAPAVKAAAAQHAEWRPSPPTRWAWA